VSQNDLQFSKNAYFSQSLPLNSKETNWCQTFLSKTQVAVELKYLRCSFIELNKLSPRPTLLDGCNGVVGGKWNTMVMMFGGGGCRKPTEQEFFVPA